MKFTDASLEKNISGLNTKTMEENNSYVKSDPVISRIGEWGRWQARVVTIFSPVGFFLGSHILGTSLMMPEQEFWCTSTDIDQAQLSDNTCYAAGNTSCTEWQFNTTTFTDTVVSQFQLVCER